MTRYPNVKVSLNGLRRNAFALAGRVSAALLAARVSRSEVEKFQREALSNGARNAPEVALRWVAFA